MKVRILGCGTSSGVPRIGNDWGRCDPNDPRNRRSRSSILVESGAARVLVDCGPDMREQLLSADIDRVDHVIVTHDHADHSHGIDDLRQISHLIGRPVPLHARPETLRRLRKRFSYIFEGSPLYPSVVEANAIESELKLGDASLRFT